MNFFRPCWTFTIFLILEVWVFWVYLKTSCCPYGHTELAIKTTCFVPNLGFLTDQKRLKTPLERN